MKKILLVAAVALVAVSASAMNRNHASVSRFANEKKTAITTLGAFKNMSEKKAAMNAFYADANVERKLGEVQIVNRRAGEADPELIPAFSTWTYHYTTVMGGFVPQIMYSDASFLVENGKAYFAPFTKLGYVEGVVESGTNMYSEAGADSITFTADIIATYTDSKTGKKASLVLEPCYVENYTPHRLGSKTFGAYYFAEDNELYLPDTYALFELDETKTEVFDEALVARRLYLIPQESLYPYISKGTVECTTYYSNASNYSGNVEVLLGNGYYNVKGCDPEADDAWVEFDVNESDETILDVPEGLFIARYNFYNDESRTATHPGDVCTVGLLQENGTLTAFNKDNNYVSTYKITDNADETSTIANTAGTVYGDYVYEKEEDGNGGMMNAVDMKITITYELAYTGINEVSSENEKFAGATFNLNGQKVNASQKGLVIRDGKKFFVK